MKTWDWGNRAQVYLCSPIFSSIWNYINNTSSGFSLIESGNLSKISIIPDISVSIFGMVISPDLEYVINEYTGTFSQTSNLFTTNSEYLNTIFYY